MTPKAVRDTIIVLKDKVEEATEKGIIVPAGLQRTPRFSPTIEATILAVGPKVREPALKVGGRIGLNSAWGDDYFIDNKTLTILTEREYRDCWLVEA